MYLRNLFENLKQKALSHEIKENNYKGFFLNGRAQFQPPEYKMMRSAFQQ